MRVRVLYFASFRDAVGRTEEVRELPEGSQVSDLWAILAREVPAFAQFPRSPAVAVNQIYSDPGQHLRDGDEVAYLPPVAGGSCT